ncbi:HK97 family phage prohead protease [Pseudonocardia sp.]|uniref:HK97 family phage prohead protease n=1 Tax=Pseudonocardia sp. TaxID=60912 RepID=UPI003D09913B
MEILRDLDVVRDVPRKVEFRAADPAEGDDAASTDESLGLMTGHFSMFNNWYEIDSWWEGRFLESIAPGAFRKTLAEGRDLIKVLYDHGMDPQIGNKVLGPHDSREDGDGAYYECPLFDTSYNRDLLPGLRAGVYGSSFRFRVIRDEWNEEPGKSDYNPEGIPERTIKEVRVFEFGPVTFPANPEATAGVRSGTDDFYERLQGRNPERVSQLRSRVLGLRGQPAGAATSDDSGADSSAEVDGEQNADIRTPDADAARDAGTSADGAAGNPTDAPAPSHPSGLTPSQRRERLFPFLTKESAA